VIAAVLVHAEGVVLAGRLSGALVNVDLAGLALVSGVRAVARVGGQKIGALAAVKARLAGTFVDLFVARAARESGWADTVERLQREKSV